jgi:hypothetical protein
VIRLAPVGRGASPHLLAPVVRLVTRTGRVMEVRGLAEKYPSVGPGDHLPVVYPPEAPERAAIAGVRELWGAPLACLVIAFLLAGTAALLRASERGAAVPALVGGVALLLGVPLLLAATLMAVGRLALLRDGVRASGEVTNAGGRTRRWSQPRSGVSCSRRWYASRTPPGREIRVVMPRGERRVRAAGRIACRWSTGRSAHTPPRCSASGTTGWPQRSSEASESCSARAARRCSGPDGDAPATALSSGVPRGPPPTPRSTRPWHRSSCSSPPGPPSIWPAVSAPCPGRPRRSGRSSAAWPRPSPRASVPRPVASARMLLHGRAPGARGSQASSAPALDGRETGVHGTQSLSPHTLESLWPTRCRW